MDPQAVLVCRVSFPRGNDSIVPLFFVGDTGGAELFKGWNIPSQSTILTEKKEQGSKNEYTN
mgnify:FL=1